MKRRIYMAAVLMTALTMTACNTNIVPEITGTDYTVEAPVTYNPEDYKGKVEEVSGEACYAWAATKENIVKHADAMIEGTVISFEYTSVGSLPWTKLDVVVTESYDNVFCAGDAISLYYMGGYMPLKAHYEALAEESSSGVVAYGQEIAEDAMFHISRTFDEPPEQGSSFLFSVAKPLSDALPDGAYEICCSGEEGVYKKTGEGVYYCESTETEWTAEELSTLIEERNTQALES